MKLAILLYSSLSLTVGPDAARLQKGPFVFHHENVMGTSLELRLDAATRADAERAEAAALAEIDRLSAILSTYDPQSDASRWLQTRGVAVPVSPELFEVLSLFDTWRTRTGGALDPASEAISRVWRNAATQNRKPTNAELRTAVAEIRESQHWSLDAGHRTATHLSAAPVRFNTFVKSYVVEHAANAAIGVDGVTGAVLNAGGDIITRGVGETTIDIADPTQPSGVAAQIVAPSGMTVATSGGYHRGFDIGGVHYSHIVDPRTGFPAGNDILSATVVAPSAADAGALATSMTILTPEESRQLVAAYVPAAEYLLIAQDGARIASRGWYAMQAKGAAGSAAAAHKVTINFELARIEGGRYRRPYVAVWIEDGDKFPVRTVALWYEKPRWLPDLRAWNRGDRMRALAEGTEITNTVASATRSPGKYTLEWDGKDNQGKALKPGKYAVCIEVAREHGTYQLIRQEIDFGGAAGAKQYPLQANPEVAAASLEYR